MKRVLVVVSLFLLAVGPDRVTAQESSPEKPAFYGDFRGRMEMDRSSKKTDGSLRSDRDRLRYRGRFGMRYQRTDRLELGWRLRTGDPASRQSPHLTLGDELSALPFSLDRLYARYSFDRGAVWFGKNSNPFWHQNEMFWDDDVSLDGLAGQVILSDGDGARVEARGGYFVLDVPQSNSFSDQARLIAGQVLVSGSRNELAYTAAASLTSISENANAPDERLADLDYRLLSGSVQLSYSGLAWPVRVGADFVRNSREYDAGLYNHDQQTGFVLSLQAGSLSSPGRILLRYTFAHIEKYAVVGAYSQDDWVRWGSATTTNSSNFAGHELRAAYAVGAGQNLVVRFYRVEGIELESSGAVALQTGTRLRVDWNISI